MRRLALLAVLLPVVAYGDIILKDEGTRVGPITTINCSGADVTCARSGSTATITVGPSGAAAAPKDADYLVKTANATLTAERVVTDTATATWDWSTAGQAKVSVVKLPANAANCGTGNYARGVDEFGAAENCSPDQGVGTLVVADIDTSNATTAYANITGLTWAAATNTRYEFHCYLMYQSSVTTTGVMFAVNGPVGASVDYRLEIQTAGNPGTGAMSTVTQPWTHGVILDEATVPTAGVTVITTNYYATIVGTLNTGETSGTMAIRHKSETANTTTVKAGSWCVYY